MITLVIYGLLAVALAAAAGYAFIVFTTTSRQLIQLQENQTQMNAAATAIQANLLSYTGPGYAYPPMGATVAGTYTQLPIMLGSINAAPWGQPYEYCPVSPTTTTTVATTAANVQSSTGATDYSVGVYSGHVVTTPATVIANRTGYVGFIVSTLGPGQTMPACSSIKVNQTVVGLTVPGGIVRGITSGLPIMQSAVSATDRLEIYVDPNATGNGSGVDAANAMTSLGSALGLWRIVQPRLTEIYLEKSGNYSTTDTLSGEAPVNGLLADGSSGRYDARGENTSLIIETYPSQVTNDGTDTALATVAFQSPLVLTSSTTFQNVNVTIKLAGSQMITAYKPLIFRTAKISPNAGIGSINLYNTSLASTDSNFGSATLYAMNSNVEFLNYTNNTSPAGSIYASGSTISFDNFASSQQVYTTGTIVLSASTMNIGNYLADGTVTTPYVQVPSVTAYASIVNVAPSAELRFQQSNLLANGSRLNVSLGGTINNYVVGSVDGMTAKGSTIGIDGKYYLYNITSGGGIIGSRQGTLVGSGQIYAKDITTTSCIDILNAGPNYSTITIPANSTQANYVADEPGFTDVQYGMPPLLAFKASDARNPTLLGYSGTPYLTLGPLYLPGNFPLSPTSRVEAGIRGIANQDFVSGLNINFLGACAAGFL